MSGGSLRGRGDRYRGNELTYQAPDQLVREWPFDDDVATLLRAVVAGAEEKLARDVVVLDVRELQDTFDALVVTSGRNDRQVRAIAEEVERVVGRSTTWRPLHVEGWAVGSWIALDYGDVVVHIFDEESRDYFDLEHLWSAATAYRSDSVVYSD